MSEPRLYEVWYFSWGEHRLGYRGYDRKLAEAAMRDYADCNPKMRSYC